MPHPDPIPKSDLERLRALMKKQARIAALPVMERRRQRWTDTNDAKPGARPPVAIESWTWDRDFLPDALLQCRSPLGRQLERDALRHIRHHEILDDDHVCPDTLDVDWQVELDEFGIPIPVESRRDSGGVALGYKVEHPIKDLAREGFNTIKPSTFRVNREATLEYKALLEDRFGDILPVVLRGNVYIHNCLTQRIMRLMSMETFFMAMYDCPDTLHGLMGLMRDNAMRMARWAEEEGLFSLNNGNQQTCGTCYNFTTLLPKSPVAPGEAVKRSDRWTSMDSQETVGVSPAVFHEFIFPYYRDLAETYGWVYWGCCEPADPIWETSLSTLPHLKAVSISRWANQAYMAEALDGRGIVFSRKPDPNLLGVAPELDEAAWAAEIRSTLDAVAGKNLPLAFVVRDVYTMHGNLEKPRRAVEIAREQIARYYGPEAP